MPHQTISSMLRPSFPVLVAALGCALFVVSGAYGQQPDTTQLPEIAPREIEIRGEREIALPSLERQPLTGFASPPTIPAIPADHTPFVAPYEQELEDLPESLPIPETVAAPLTPAATPARGFIQGGGGRYFSRFLEGRVIAPLSDHELVSLHGDYAGMEGFSPFAGETVETPSDVVDARVRFESRRRSVRLGASAYGSAQSYTLYGTPQNPDEADRDAYSVGASLGLANRGATEAAARVRYEQTEFTSNLFGGRQRVALDYRERQAAVNGTLTAPVPLQPHAEGTYAQSWFGGNARDDQGYSVNGRGTVSLFQSDSSSLEVGASVLSFEAPAVPTSAVATSVGATYAVPFVNAEWQLSPVATLFVRNRPRLTEPSLNKLYTRNPYAEHAPSVRPTVETTNAHAGVILAAGSVRFSAGGGYRYAPTFRFFEPGPTVSLSDGLFSVEYGTAQIIEGEGQIALQGLGGVQGSLGVSVRNGTLESTDADIPGFATITGNAMLSVSFANGDGYLEGQGHYEGPRYASRTQSNRLDPYFTFDLEGSYAISPNIEILVRAENLAFQNPTLWQGYPRPPAQISSGLRIQW